MWTTDIGRYGASNYGLLKVIFEVNLKLFDQKSSKKLLFVLRDFDDRAGNFDRIRKILEGDVDKIWSEIYKPEKFENSKCTDFFNFEYSMLPHKIYQEEKFYEKTTELKNRFVVGAENSLFLSDSEEKNVPMDGLTFFID
jgi:protein SEY1